MDEYAFSAATEGSKHVFTAHFLELKKKLNGMDANIPLCTETTYWKCLM